MPELPFGTVTFLFTDIEGSTPLWEKIPGVMETAIQIHHTVLREAIEAKGGVVFKIIGDAFQAAFSLPLPGLLAAIEGQHKLLSTAWPAECGPLKVRMGLHIGPASLDACGDYAVSHTLNRVARVMSSGHGGQILLSQEARDLIERLLPRDTILRDLGSHHMKGMSIPEHLYQVVAPGLPADFPVMISSMKHPINLPPDQTSFIGRDAEITTLKDMIQRDARRLVTLTGAGGTGKTRLSIQAGRELLESFPDGVWLVELASLSDPDMVIVTIARSLGVLEGSGTSMYQHVMEYLQNKRLLLILDNCEHLLEECSALADRLIRNCPGLYLLATSREVLGLSGEHIFRVPPLASPDPERMPTLNQLDQYAGMRLFTERTCQVRPDFVLDSTNALPVAQICKRLDGIPLAIELAAARMRMMTVQQIAARLDNVFRLLSGGTRNVLPRQQTLKATIDWSFALLAPQERSLLLRLAVFAGSWSLEAAEAVCCGDGIDSFEVIDLLTRLVDKSLVTHLTTQTGEGRYRMLVTVRQYASERLLEQGVSETIRNKHLVYYLKLAEQANENVRGPLQPVWLDRLEDEIDNLRLALEWSFVGYLEEGLRLASALRWLWHYHDRFSEGIEWLTRLFRADTAERGAEPMRIGSQSFSFLMVRIRAANALIPLYFYAYAPFPVSEAKDLLDRNISLCREIGSTAKRELACFLMFRGEGIIRLSKQQSIQDLEESLKICQENHFRIEEMECLQIQSMLTENLDQRQKCLEASLVISRSLGDKDAIATRLGGLATIAHLRGHDQTARELIDESIYHSQQAGNLRAACKTIIERYYWFPEPENARPIEGALNYFRDRRYAVAIDSISRLIEAEWSLGNFLKASQLADEVQTARLKHVTDSNNILPLLLISRIAISQDDLMKAKALFTEITRLKSEEILAFSENWRSRLNDLEYVIDSLAVFMAHSSQMEPAARLFGAEHALYEKYHRGCSQRLQDEHDSAIALARQALGDEIFSKEFQIGQAMTLQEAYDFGKIALSTA